jgi:hypothetical protein
MTKKRQPYTFSAMTEGMKHTYIRRRAVQNRLVSAHGLADAREGLDDAEPELLPLLALVDGNVLNVADGAEPAEELALHEDAANGNDCV